MSETNTRCPLDPNGIHTLDGVARLCECGYRQVGHTLRELMLKQDMELEMTLGMHLTSPKRVKTGFQQAKLYYGLVSRDKLANYLAFCAITEQKPKNLIPDPAKRGRYLKVESATITKVEPAQTA